MKCFYINLESAKSRRASVESNFQKNNSENFVLTRFPAIDAQYIEKNNIGGRLRASEKACFLSHRKLIRNNVDSAEPILIMEDDVEIGLRTFEMISKILKTVVNLEWDIIFTDICIPQPKEMVELIIYRKLLSIKDQIDLINLKNFVFAGATSYIINKNSINKIANMLDQNEIFDIPYDIYIRKLIHENKLIGLCVFPFITTLSNESNLSNIQLQSSAYTDLIWNTFRQMIWLERDLEKVKPSLNKISENVCDVESNLFGIILSARLSDKYVNK